MLFESHNLMVTSAAPLQRHPPNAGVWEQAFAATDQGLECDDGCTATAALAWLDEAGALNLQTANVGDSSGVWIVPQHGGPPQVPPSHRTLIDCLHDGFAGVSAV
jgi:hypothetical protein